MSNPSPSRSFIGVFFATFITLMLITGIVLLFTWLFLRPTLPQVTVTTLSLSNFNTSKQGGITGTWRLFFTIRNTNKKTSITYTNLRSSLFYHSNFIGQSLLAKFNQHQKSKLTLNAAIFSDNNAYFEPRAVTDISGDRSKGSVPFDVQSTVSTEFSVGLWKFRKPRTLQIVCRNIPVGVSSNTTSGELVGGSKECQVQE